MPSRINRSALLKMAGGALIVYSVYSIIWGVSHLSEPPMQGSRLPYASSRQLQAISAGMAGIVLGVGLDRLSRDYSTRATCGWLRIGGPNGCSSRRKERS